MRRWVTRSWCPETLGWIQQPDKCTQRQPKPISNQLSPPAEGISATNAWKQLGPDIDGEAAGDYSGVSVSLSADGSTVAIGAAENDGNGSDAGHVRI